MVSPSIYHFLPSIYPTSCLRLKSDGRSCFRKLEINHYWRYNFPPVFLRSVWWMAGLWGKYPLYLLSSAHPLHLHPSLPALMSHNRLGVRWLKWSVLGLVYTLFSSIEIRSNNWELGSEIRRRGSQWRFFLAIFRPKCFQVGGTDKYLLMLFRGLSL